MVSKYEGRATIGVVQQQTWLIAALTSRAERKRGPHDETKSRGRRDLMIRQEDRADGGMRFLISYVHASVLTMVERESEKTDCDARYMKE